MRYLKVKEIKLLSLLFYVILTCILVLFIKPVYLISILIVLVPPAIVNFFWLKKSKKKILIFSLITTFLFAFAVELVSRLANSWDVQSVLPRVFGFLPLENMLFAFLNVFWVLSFYEYFVDRDTSSKVSKKFKYIIILFSLFSLIVFGLYFVNVNIAMNYFIVAIITLITPSFFLFYKKPRLLKKTIIPTIFFAAVFFIYEIVSLIIGSWWWPGDYLFTINLFGNLFPIDDVLIWYFLSTITCIGAYEFFVDDYK